MKPLLFVILFLGLFICGCMVGPDYNRPKTLAETAQKYVYADGNSADVNDPNVINRWWHSFADDVTVELVEQALAGNFDLQAAAARVLQSEALLAETTGGRLPQVDYNFSRTRSKTSFNFGAGRSSNLSTTFSQDISVSYIVDLFGKLKRSERAAWADLFASRANQQTLVNAVISSVVNARITIATLQRSLEITRANTESWARNLEIIERRYNKGLVGPLDVRLTRENLAASKSTEFITELSLIKAQNALDVLLSRRPGQALRLPQTLGQLPDLKPVPVGMPVMLLERRPDVKAAEMVLQAGSERIGVSIAQLYPDLTLSGAVGRSADRFGDIFKHETEIYSAVIRAAQPIFRGGQLRAEVERRRAVYAELAANYAKVVLTAMREVEDALVNERLLQGRLEAVGVRFTEAVAAEKLAMDRYLRGVEKLLIVLETQRRRRNAELELNNIKGQIWSGRVELLLALGGDWDSGLPDEKEG